MTGRTSKSVIRLWRLSVILAALSSTAAMPPISQQARAALDRTLGAKGVYVDEESAYTFAFPRTDLSVHVGRQRLSPAQTPRSWATFSPSMGQEGMMNGEIIALEAEVNRAMSAALGAGLQVTGLSGTLLFEHPRLLTSIRKRTVAEHPETLFIGVWKQGTAFELATGLRFALDVEVGAAKVASNSDRK
jgi:hypothetical protein